MDSNLGLDDRLNRGERRLRTPDLRQGSDNHLRRKMDPKGELLLGTGDGIGVGGTFRLSWTHSLNCLRIEQAFFPLTQLSQV